MTRVLFESSVWLGGFCFLLFAVVLLIRPRWESAATRRYALPVTLLLIALLFLTQRLVVTQREEILAALEELVTAVEQKNVAAIGGLISEDYQDRHRDRDGFIDHVGSILEAVSIHDVRYQRRDVTFDDETAAMKLAALATVGIRRTPGQTHWGVWRIDWVREADGWRILSIDPVKLDGQPIETLGGIRLPADVGP